MNIYLVERITPTHYDEYRGFVLRAVNEEQALKFAIECATPEWVLEEPDEDEWKQSRIAEIQAQFKGATITLLGVSIEDEPMLILADYLHG